MSLVFASCVFFPNQCRNPGPNRNLTLGPNPNPNPDPNYKPNPNPNPTINPLFTSFFSSQWIYWLGKKCPPPPGHVHTYMYMPVWPISLVSPFWHIVHQLPICFPLCLRIDKELLHNFILFYCNNPVAVISYRIKLNWIELNCFVQARVQMYLYMYFVLLDTLHIECQTFSSSFISIWTSSRLPKQTASVAKPTCNMCPMLSPLPRLQKETRLHGIMQGYLEAKAKRSLYLHRIQTENDCFSYCKALLPSTPVDHAGRSPEYTSYGPQHNRLAGIFCGRWNWEVKGTTCRPYKTLGQQILGQFIVARNWYIQENDQRGNVCKFKDPVRSWKFFRSWIWNSV
jgi:hypothetical protein